MVSNARSLGRAFDEVAKNYGEKHDLTPNSKESILPSSKRLEVGKLILLCHLIYVSCM